MKHLFILNWKMYLSHSEGITWINRYKNQLFTLSKQASIVVCPPYTLISECSKTLSPHIQIGAQDCSNKSEGPFTGDCSARSLKEAGATLCIVGHYERRLYHHESIETIIEKIIQLLSIGVQPLICVGENGVEEIQTILQRLITFSPRKLLIAYEPESAIGGETTPPIEHIKKQLILIKTEAEKILPKTKCELIYGGNVTANSIASIGDIHLLEGFLLGRASIDIQMFEKIVSLT